MLSMIGLFAGLILLIYMTMRGINIIIAALASAVVVAAAGGLNLEEALTKHYMTGFTGYFASWFLIFLFGAIFGKVMEDTGAADAIADWVKRRLGASRAVLAVVAACAIMTYGGVSLFVVGFSVYPIAVALFRDANLPHRFIPAAMVFGSVSFTMTSPGSPEIQNLIPTKFFGTDPTAGGFIGIMIGILIMVSGGFYLKRAVQKAVANGETFSLPNQQTSAPQNTHGKSAEESASALESGEKSGKTIRNLPHIVFALLPLVSVIAILNILAKFMSSTGAALISLVTGIGLGWILMWKHVQKFWGSLATGSQDALIAAANTCAVVGFGSVAAKVPAFNSVVDSLVNIPGSELLGLGIAVTLICGMTGSASGGLGIALPILAPIYMAKGIDPNAMHRVATLASGGLDSLPHNGYIVTTIRAICNESHKRAYGPIFILSVVIPLTAMFLAIILFSI
ncbi:GntP family permease [Paenactinomyces guangxiensis]|uniref:GntP family permease n=1 Tax=Paenactinomyces guangxiensis TaxID=1490290 RepID=A0A7W2A914_9BACL|nr:GntP family permease [Paenactinomyces guangxiensis]MBA4495215.1 GntP family permease [Paenactinomyces guangxiensis]MBH8592299.1 GntP family permease [Paenactinomyces guangxiensis]